MDLGREVVDDATVDAHLVLDHAVGKDPELLDFSGGLLRRPVWIDRKPWIVNLYLVINGKESAHDAPAGEEVELPQHDLALNVVAIGLAQKPCRSAAASLASSA